MIARVAAQLGLTTRQVYNLLARYSDDRTVTSILPRTGNPRRKRIAHAVEAIIEATLREKWLILEAPSLRPIVIEICARCEEANLTAPSYTAVEARIPVLFSAEEIAKKRSANAAKLRRLKARPGYIRAPQPLAVCQMDHTPTDINFVDVVDDGGKFVGRAYLTILVDVFSRCIIGFCLSLEKPQVMSVALCLAHAMCSKDTWMAERGLGHHPWPTYGRPKLIHTDSGKDFRSNAFERGCAEFGISRKYRNRGRVHEGGVVERLLGKINGVIGSLPGATGQSVADRDDYPAEQRACLTFAGLEKCVALAIVEHNSQQNDRTLKVPLTEWATHADDIVRHNDDPHRVLLTFMPGPIEGRALTPEGISLHALHYYAEWLGPLVPERDTLGKLEVRYDPRDISHIYVRHPKNGDFLPVGRRDGNVVTITLWEHERDRRLKRQANHRSFVQKARPRRDMAAIVAGDQARQRKRDARDSVRAAHSADAPKPYGTGVPKTSSEPADVSTPTPHPVRQKRPLDVEEW